MPLRELVEEALRRGEGEEAEFKLRLDKEAARTLCGLANHRGGLLLIGVNDQGKSVGAPRDSLERLNSLLGSIYPRPRVRAEWMELKGARVLAIWVEAGGRVYRLGDDVYIRVGSSTRKASPEEIASLYAERAELRFDEVVREDLGIGVLSRELLERYIELAVKRGRVPQEAQTWGFEEALNALKAASGSSPTNAGLLMFSENPSKYIQGADIRIVVQDAEGRVIDDKWFSSPLWLLVNKVADYLRE
ncbi:putative DNA binding domain-containing protein, partial [Candidatus Bathyarchaeota archaeon]|nr:putative DNA binding domain-containing protein [Candidatus Bathyarchaeota archaeon]